MIFSANLRCFVRTPKRIEKVFLVAFGPVLVSPDSPHTVASEWVKRASEARAERLSSSRPDWPRDIALCANYSASRQLLLSSGGFDESFVGACEEFDLGIRIKGRGSKFRYLPEAVVKEISRQDRARYGAG